MKKQTIRSVFFHVPLYGFDVLVVIGAKTKKEFLKQLKKQRVSSKVIDSFSKEDVDWFLKEEAGTIFPDNELRIIFHFKEWKDIPYHQKVLVHEVSHMVDEIAKYKNLVRETEARAYLSEYLFDTLRKNM